MAGVKIPGADQIEQVAPARDPGETASPDAFGAQVGVSEAHMGDALASLGAHLYQKRQAAEDQIAANTYNVNVAPALQRNEYQARQSYPDGGPGYIAASQAGSKQADAEARAAVSAAGITPSAAASQHMDTIFAGHDMNMRVGAITYDNNAGIEKLKTANKANNDALAGGVLAGNLSVDDAIKQSDSSIDSTKQLYTGGQVDAVKRAARENIYQAAVDNALAAKDPARARQLNAQFFGGSPQPGEAQATPSSDAMFNAIYGQESGSGANTTTSVTGARGGMQIQPKTWALYARPGERIDNKADNIAVGRRIIDDLSAKSGGDPARIAVGYFSGPGNIAPAGSDTPYKYDKPDPTGKFTSSYVSDVMRRLAGASPNMARALANNNRINSAEGVDRADTTSAVTDDLASVAKTGVGDATLTADRITKSLGPNAAADWETARARAKDFYDKTQDFPTLPAEQINARLIALAPKPGQEEFAAQDALHSSAIKKADAIMEARKKDPAESVSDDPEVKKAIAASATNPDDVNLRTRIITARMAAQQRAGIAAPAPLPVDETQRLLKPINDAVQMEDLDRTKGGPSRIVLAQKQLVKDLQEKYGSYAPDVMREVIGQAAQSRDRLVQADAAGKVMANLINGVPVDPKEARRLKLANEAAAATRALAAKPPPPPGTEYTLDNSSILGIPPSAVTPPAPHIIPSRDRVQILLNAPQEDQARLAGLFDKKYGAGSAAAILNNRKVAPTGVAGESAPL